MNRKALQRRQERPSIRSAGANVCLAVAFAVVPAVTVAPATASAATVTVSSEQHGDAIHIRASAVLNADAATAWHVLTDYDRYPEFIPDLRTSRIVARRGATVTVQQSGDAALWLFKWPLDITFEIQELPPNGLRSRAVAGSLHALASRYTLTTVESGVRLDYEGDIAPGLGFYGNIGQIAVRQNVARQFQALADEIERKSTIVQGHLPARGPLEPVRSSRCDSTRWCI